MRCAAGVEKIIISMARAFGNSADRSLTLPCVFFFNDTATTEIYTLSLHDALPISRSPASTLSSPPRTVPTPCPWGGRARRSRRCRYCRSEEHTSELQSHSFISYAVFCLKKKILKSSSLNSILRPYAHQPVLVTQDVSSDIETR